MGQVAGCFEKGNELSRSIKCKEETVSLSRKTPLHGGRCCDLLGFSGGTE
jgi:hypothetical protein